MQNKANTLPLYLLAAIFILPMMMGWFLYHYRAHFHFNTTNLGVLVNPPISVHEWYATNETKEGKKWGVMFVDKGVCDVSCNDINYQLHQVQKALGANRERVQVLTVHGHDTIVENLKTQFVVHGNASFEPTDKIYLIDPDGNLFMYYIGETNPMNVLKDLKKVLEVSQIG